MHFNAHSLRLSHFLSLCVYLSISSLSSPSLSLLSLTFSLPHSLPLSPSLSLSLSEADPAVVVRSRLGRLGALRRARRLLGRAQPPPAGIASCCGLLRLVAAYCGLNWLVAACCGLLRLIARSQEMGWALAPDHCSSLRLIAPYCVLLHIAVPALISGVPPKHKSVKPTCV